MAIALDPTVRRVWRSPRTVQFGVDRALLVLDDVTEVQERILAALDGGITRAALRIVAARSGGSAEDVDAFLERLTPVLASDSEPAAVESPVVVLDGDGPTSSRIAALLGESGVAVRSGLAWTDPGIPLARCAVIVASYAVEPQRHARWLRRDVPHLPVVFGDTGVTVGPFVEPGAGPCIRCVDLHRTDTDPAWPAMAAQLHTAPRAGETALVACAVSSAVASVVLARLRRGEHLADSMRYDRGRAEWTQRSWRPHPDCGCLELPLTPAEDGSRSRRGIATVGASSGVPAGSPAAPS